MVHVLLFPLLYTSVLPRMYPRACGFGSILSVVSNMSGRSYTPINDVPGVNSSDDDDSGDEATPDHDTSQQQQHQRQRGREQERRNSVAKDEAKGFWQCCALRYGSG